MKRVAFASVMIVMLMALVSPSTAFALGATQFSGIAYWPDPGQCTDAQGAGASYAVHMTGDLTGCHYSFVETATCSPSGAYNETGHEIFVGWYQGQFGTFETTYRFTAKYNNCVDFVELTGRCEHPLIDGSGTGVFYGMTGRLDMHDDVAAGNFPYRGHLR